MGVVIYSTHYAITYYFEMVLATVKVQIAILLHIPAGEDFYWTDGSPVVYTQWGPFMPGANLNHCTVLDADLADWFNDIECTQALTFVCKLDPSTITTTQEPTTTVETTIETTVETTIETTIETTAEETSTESYTTDPGVSTTGVPGKSFVSKLISHEGCLKITWVINLLVF